MQCSTGYRVIPDFGVPRVRTIPTHGIQSRMSYTPLILGESGLMTCEYSKLFQWPDLAVPKHFCNVLYFLLARSPYLLFTRPAFLRIEGCDAQDYAIEPYSVMIYINFACRYCTAIDRVCTLDRPRAFKCLRCEEASKSGDSRRSTGERGQSGGRSYSSTKLQESYGKRTS